MVIKVVLSIIVRGIIDFIGSFSAKMQPFRRIALYCLGLCHEGYRSLRKCVISSILFRELCLILGSIYSPCFIALKLCICI